MKSSFFEVNSNEVIAFLDYSAGGVTIKSVPHICAPDDDADCSYSDCRLSRETETIVSKIIEFNKYHRILDDSPSLGAAFGRYVVASIAKRLDSNLSCAFEDSAIVAGGCYSSLASGTRVNDVDIFFKNPEFIYKFAEIVNGLVGDELSFDLHSSKQDTVALTFIEESEHVKGINIGSGRKRIVAQVSTEISMESGIEIVAIGPNAFTLYADGLNFPIQFVFRFFPEDGDALLEEFDFVHTKHYFDAKGDKFVSGDNQIGASVTKTLLYTGSKYPFSSMVRGFKYSKRGWNISPKDLFLIAFDISKIDFNNPDELLDQLTSIDVAYFLDALSASGLDANTLVEEFSRRAYA